MAFIFVKNIHAVVAGIRTCDFLRHVHLSYHLTYTSLVISQVDQAVLICENGKFCMLKI